MPREAGDDEESAPETDRSRRGLLAAAAAAGVGALAGCQGSGGGDRPTDAGTPTGTETARETATATATDCPDESLRDAAPEPVGLGDLGAPTEETVAYPGLDGVAAVAYESLFHGPDNGVNRDYAAYGYDYESRGATALEGEFASVRPGSADSYGRRVALADVTGSGRADLLVYDPESGTVAWREGASADGVRPGRFAGEVHRFEWGRGPGAFAAADVDGDGVADLALVDFACGTVRVAYGDGEGGFGDETVADVDVSRGQLAAGDVEGDGYADLIVYDGAGNGDLRTLHGDGTGAFPEATGDPWPEADGSGQLVAADLDQDRRCDVALYRSAVEPDGFAVRFGRGDGTYGPRESEVGTPGETNLHASVGWTVEGGVPVAGQVDRGGCGDLGVFDPELGLLTVSSNVADAAYDYAPHLVEDAETGAYHLWTGGRWLTVDEDRSQRGPAWDGDHALYSYSPDGRRWFRQISRPVLYQGAELGETGWWTGNYLEPEVVRVDGTYYMYWQVQITEGDPIDGGETATAWADRVGVATSTDGRTWERRRDRGVVVGFDRPRATAVHHQEVIYVPDDPDGRPWWLYVVGNVDGASTGYVRIRSADPTTYDWADREQTAGMSQIGNQIGYVNDTPVGRLFVRITFGSEAGSSATYPTVQLSGDGLDWASAAGAPALAGPSASNTYFLALSTLDGTGRIARDEDGTARALYAATVADSPVAPEIFGAEIGTGELRLSVAGD